MDDILIARKTDPTTFKGKLCMTLQRSQLQIAPEKIQSTPPWKYLGWKILTQTIEPQKVAIQREIRTLNDVQILLGNINWVRTLLSIDNKTLEPLLELLKGDTDLNAPRELTLEAQRALKRVNEALSLRQAHRVIFGVPIELLIINNDFQPVGVIMQWAQKEPDPLKILEWVFLANQPTKTIITRPEMFAPLIMKEIEL